MGEAIEQKKTLEYLKAHSEFWLVMRINSGKVRQGSHWIQLAPEGTPDVIAFGDCPYFFEMKSADGKLSEVQQDMRKKILDCGYAVYISGTFDKVRKEIENHERRKGRGYQKAKPRDFGA